eukprot:13814341-Alexandrium_andersonii.AAC.1
MAASRGPRPRRLIGLACAWQGSPVVGPPDRWSVVPALGLALCASIGETCVARAPSPAGPPDRRGQGL